MKQVLKCTAILLAALLAGCTEETQNGGGDNKPDPGETDSGQRREVLLTLKNKLALKEVSTKAGDPIATAEENTISTLDLYVFAAADENGEYTFQERFAYRADGSELPEGASELELTPGKDDTQTTGLLNLKKGLFAKLYCIANQTALVDPAHEDETLTDAAFVPLTFTKPGEQGTQVATLGQPTETAFLTFHTPLLNTAAKGDTLRTPLAMSGAYTTPIDLTDFNSSARVQAGFKLTRLAARFDIINKAEESRFSIETVSMGNGRRGATLFPIRIYGKTPDAQPEELITYPFRAFYGDKANTGTQTGAFYSYPSPLNDKGYMILKGKYQVNKTESKDVSYQIPFTQTDGNGNETSLEINNNHRYTIAITKADDYHLDFTLTVADWADDGSIEYNPDEDDNELLVTIPDAFKDDTEYDPDTRSVSMSLKPDSKFELETTASSNLMVEKKYVGGLAAQQYDWLEVSEPAVSTKTALNFTYTFSLKDGYTLGRYPRAVLRFTNTMNGDETTFFVEAVAAPQADNTTQPGENNPNSFDAENLQVNLYRTTDSKAHVRITCPDGTEVESKPDWIDVTIDKQNGAETIYLLTLNDRDITGVPDDKGTVIFRNSKAKELKTDITVQLLDATLKPDFTNSTIDGSKNSYEAPVGDTPANINMQISDANSFAVNCKSMQGIEIGMDFDGGPEWLKAAGANVTKAYNQNAELTFSLNNDKLGGAKKATVTLKNKVGGKNTVFTVSPVFLVPTVAFVSGSNSPTQNTMSGTTIKLYQVKDSRVSFKANALGGTYVKKLTGDITVTADDNYNTEKTYVVTWKSGASASFIIANKSDETKETATYNVSAPVTTITATDNLNMNTLTSQNVTNTINSPEGCTATVSWGTGGQAWFNLSATNLNANNQALKMTTVNDIATKTNIQKATVTLTNKITGGVAKTFTVTPVFQTPTVIQTSSNANTLNGDAITIYKDPSTPSLNSFITLQITAIGGSSISVTNGLSVTSATSSTSAVTSYTVKVVYNTNQSSGTITIKNKDASKSKQLNVNIATAQVIYPGTNEVATDGTIRWIGPVIKEGTWNDATTANTCPTGWRVQDWYEIKALGKNANTKAFLDALLKNVGPSGEVWGSSALSNGEGSVFAARSYDHFGNNKETGDNKSKIKSIRCVKDK